MKRQLDTLFPPLAVLIVVVSPLLAQDQPAQEPAAVENAPAEADSEAPAKREPLRIALEGEFPSEAAYLDWAEARAADLENEAANISNPAREIELILASANRLLASEPEHALTVALLDITQDEMPDRTRLAAALDKADALLARAGAETTAFREANAEDEQLSRVASELSLRKNTLSAYSGALRAMLLSEAGEEGARARRRAASLLSSLLESQSAEIRTSARLLQAVLRSEDDVARALSILGPVTAQPPVGSQPYHFYSALYHCRLLARKDSPTLALSMVMRIEEMIETWFSDQRDRGQAGRTCAFVRVGILEQWAASLSDRPDRVEETSWCQERILGLQDAWFGGERPWLLRVAPAVPLLVTPEDLAVPDRSSAMKKAQGDVDEDEDDAPNSPDDQ